MRQLTRISGLELSQLRILYQSALAAAAPGDPIAAQTPIGLMLANDPHKGLVLTRKAPGAPLSLGPISGR
jgi:hypothetical protein